MTDGMPLHRRRSIRLRGFNYTRAAAYFVTVCTQDRACLFGAIVDGTVRLNEAGKMVQSIWEAIPAHYPGVQVEEFVAMPNHVHGIIRLPGPDVGAAPCGRPGHPDHNLGDVGAGAVGQAQGPAPTSMGGDVVATGSVDVGAAPCGRPGHPDHNLGDVGAGAVGQAQGPAPTNMGGDVGAGTGGGNRVELAAVADNGATGTCDVGAAPCGRPLPSPMSLGDIVQRFKSLTTKRYRDGVRESAWPEFGGRLWQRNYHEHIVRNEADLNRIRQYIRDNPAQWVFDSEYPSDSAGQRQAKR